MRITVKENNRDRILQVVCNCCRRPLPVENGIVLEDYIHVDKAWGYFSEHDGEKIAFDLCENCTHELTKRFRLPVYKKKTFGENCNELKENREKMKRKCKEKRG